MLSQNPFTKINSQDYLLVIEPSEEVVSEVKRFKAKAFDLIGPFYSFKSKAHITVNHYYNRKALFFDERIATYRNMVSRINSFSIKVCGFDFFEHQDTFTIYAKVELNPDIKAAFQQLRKVFGSDVRNTPHITIARNLSAAQYKILWDYFEKLKFECSFYTEEIVVLTAPTIIAHNPSMEIKTEFKFKSAV